MESRNVRAGVIGWPAGHSLSPLIHAWWRKQYNIAGSYEHLPCPDDEAAFADFVETCSREGFTGANITIPHKARAAAIAGNLTETTALLGVANTLTFSGGKIHADNTDAYGFGAALKSVLNTDDRRERALVLGAGGAAPAVCLALHEAGYTDILVSNRTASRAEALAARFGFVGQTVPWESIAEALGKADIVVNTTSLGMKGQPPLQVDFSAAPDHQIAADIIYTPLETAFLKAARERGLRSFNGLLMLAHQAVPGFERWTGIRPAVTDELLASLVARLSGEVAPVNIALTGSIGMGKSTVADMFARLGAAVWNADEAVHRLYAKGGAAVLPMKERFPEVVADGAVSREKLSDHLLHNPGDFPTVEAIVHPLVGVDRAAFSAEAQKAGYLGCVMDIPLLFEKHLEAPFDAVVVVTADEKVRRARVMARSGMTAEKYAAITARQMPEADKRSRANHVIRTDATLDETFRSVRDIWRTILENHVY